MQDSSNWILNSPESLVILMSMATGMAFLFFGSFATVMFFGKNWFLMVLFGIFSLLSLKQFIKLIKTIRKLGLKNALGNITAREFVWHKNKYGGVADGSNGSVEEDEVGSKSDAVKNKRIREEVGHIYR